MATCPSKLTKCNLCLLYHALAQLPNAIICKRSTYSNLINMFKKKLQHSCTIIQQVYRWFQAERPFLSEGRFHRTLFFSPFFLLLVAFTLFSMVQYALTHQCEKVYNPHHSHYLLLLKLVRIPGRIDNQSEKSLLKKPQTT